MLVVLLATTDSDVQVWELRKELVNFLEELGPRLPFNTLDELIQQLGGPSVVAEVCIYTDKP